MRLRLSDPSYAERLAAFLRSVGVATAPAGDTLLAIESGVDADEITIYLRVWAVLNPGLKAEPVGDEA